MPSLTWAESLYQLWNNQIENLEGHSVQLMASECSFLHWACDWPADYFPLQCSGITLWNIVFIDELTLSTQNKFFVICYAMPCSAGLYCFAMFCGTFTNVPVATFPLPDCSGATAILSVPASRWPGQCTITWAIFCGFAFNFDNFTGSNCR